jgi:hypothetical protein
MKLNYKNNSSDGLRSLVPFLTLGVIGVVFLSVIPTGVHAQEFIPLVGIPYVDTQSSDLSLAGYVNALYTAAISIAAFMAVVKIIFAGVKYMLSDVVTSKEDAKKDIRGALIGLLIVIGAVLILNTINPQLKGLGALEGMTPVNMNSMGSQTACDINQNSHTCCEEQGGTYFELINGESQCPLGTLVDNPNYDTGDTVGDRYTCLTDNNVWDSTANSGQGGCRYKAAKEEVLPQSMYEGIGIGESDLLNPIYTGELSGLCQSIVAGSEYRPETNTCREM